MCVWGGGVIEIAMKKFNLGNVLYIKQFNHFYGAEHLTSRLGLYPLWLWAWSYWRLKVWSTVKIPGTRVPQKAIVPVGRPSPYSIIILNMCFIPEASLKASSQITASSYILERHIWVYNPKPLALTPTWSLACKQTDCITAGMLKLLDPSLYWHAQETQNICMTLCNVGPTSKTLGRRCINVIQMSSVCWAGGILSNIVHLFNAGSMLGQRRRRWPSIKTALDLCPV